jgi:hypothetical protein
MRRLLSLFVFAFLLLGLASPVSAADDPRRMVSGEGNYLDVDAGVPVAGAYYAFVDGSTKQGPCYYSALPIKARVWSSVTYPSDGEVAGLAPCDPSAALFGPKPSGAPVAPGVTNPQGSGQFRPAEAAPNWDNTTNCQVGEVVTPSATVPMPYKQSGVTGACELTVVVPAGYYLVLDAQMGRVNGVTYPFPLHVYGAGTYQIGFLNGSMFVGPAEHARARYGNLLNVVGPSRGIPYQPGGQVPSGW